MKLQFFSINEFFSYVLKHMDDGWKDVISPSEAGDILGVTRQRILQLVDAGTIDAAFILSATKDDDVANTSQVYIRRRDIPFIAENRNRKSGNPRKFFFNRVLENPEQMRAEFESSASGYVFSRTTHLRPFLSPKEDDYIVSLSDKANPIDTIERLRSRLASLEAPLVRPELITVTGMFLQATLLSKGLWEKDRNADVTKQIAKEPMSDLQRWLSSGFTLWAPSLDINPSIISYLNTADDRYPYLVCQIGISDEAFSMPLLISREQKNIVELIAELSAKQYSFPIKVRGLLFHKDILPIEEKELLSDYSYDYCIKVMGHAHDHNLVPSPPTKEPYSGYLWVCLGDASKKPTFSNTFWVWEHTDFTSMEAIKYNLESLEHKIKYIRDKNPDMDLAILHKSMPFINGDVTMSTDKFYDYLVGLQ